MDIIRRNTDYALRIMLNLAKLYGKEAVSSRMLAEKEEVSYQLACKLMQKLNAAGLVKSQMGPKGGFSLSKDPSEITLTAIIKAIQGPISVNNCLLGIEVCSRQPNCPINNKLTKLQEYIDGFFSDVTLNQLLESRSSKKESNANKLKTFDETP